MFIRRTTIKSRKSGEPYITYRLCESERVGSQVKQRTLLNLGRHFDVPREDWKLLTARIEGVLAPRAVLLELILPEALEAKAQRYIAGSSPAATNRRPSQHSLRSHSIAWRSFAHAASA